MKRFFCSLILPVLCAGLSAAPAEYLRVGSPGKPPIFLTHEPVTISFNLSKTDAASANLTIFNFYDRAILSKAWHGANVRKEHKVKIAPEYGVFRIRLTLTGADGKTLKTDETTFAHIPDVRLVRPRPDSPFGIGAYFAVRFTPQELAIAARLQNLLGAAWTREELLWDIVEPEKGKWDWSRTDRMVKTAHENNIHILGLLDYWGKWAPHLTDEGFAAYAEYARRMVERYKPGGVFAKEQGWKDGYGITNWEIWNEPATFWDGSGEQFGELLKRASKAAKSVAPDCRIFFSVASDTFNAAVIKEAGLSSFDGITPHFYCPPRTPEEGGIDRGMSEMLINFAKAGVKGKPFWVSEFGWHSTMDVQEMRQQAICLVRTHIYGLAAGMDKFFWYNFVNDDCNKDGQHYGLVNREDWTPRFAFCAYATMVHFLEGTKYHSRVEIVRPARIFTFEKGKGSIAVLWSSGASGVLCADVKPHFNLYDIMGNVITGSGEIPLRTEPVYLVSNEMSANELTAALNKGTIRGISSAEVRILPLVGALKNLPVLSVQVDNVSRKTLSGVLKITPPAGWKLKEITKPVRSLKAGSKTVLNFHLAEMKSSPENRYRIGAIFTEEGGGEAVASAELSELIATYGSPRIDGDTSDWKDACFIHADTPDRAVGLVPYMDWNLSAKVATMWDENNFYFLGIVRDNVFDQSNTGSQIWEGDSFQIAIDVAGADTPTTSGEGRYLYGLAKTRKGLEKWSWPVGDRNEDRPAPEIKFAFASPEKDTYVYESAFPKKLLAPLQMKEGAQFGFTFLLNDNDGGGRRGWIEWTPGIGTGYNPKFFTRWTLVK